MKLSQVDPGRLAELSDEQVTRIVYDGPPTGSEHAVAALVLGGPAKEMGERALSAATLYRVGLAPCLIPTGGVRRLTKEGEMTESEYLARQLAMYNVPEDAILPENEATTTRENMLFGSVLLERALKPRGAFAVYIVTSAYHLRRSMALARLYLPRTALVLGDGVPNIGGSRDEWMNSPYWTFHVRNEVRLLKGMADCGEIDDIEF